MEIDRANKSVKDNMHIVLCTDENYIMPCGVSIISLLENNKNNSITLHIMGIDLKKEAEDKLSSICSEYPNALIVFYNAKKGFLDSWNSSSYDSKHMNHPAYLRLFIGNIISQNIDKVIYLDCDIIVTKNLSELWNTNIERYSVAGVLDLHMCCSHLETFHRLGYSSTKQYINSGVLLINLKYWREKDIVRVFINFARENHGNLLLFDQDIINGTLHDSKLILPIKYNIINTYYWAKNDSTNNYKDEIYSALKDPAIIHYTSPEKPWFKLCLHPLRSEFIKYKNVSPWKNNPLVWPDVKLYKKVRYYKRKILYALKLKKQKYMIVKKDINTGKYNIKIQ